jgi:hypothetical protein
VKLKNKKKEQPRRNFVHGTPKNSAEENKKIPNSAELKKIHFHGHPTKKKKTILRRNVFAIYVHNKKSL